jgi:2,4'-dihydroxyacetophenone dioxygenase
VNTVPLAQHVGVLDVPWVDNPRFPGARQRLLQADVEAGISVMAGVLPAGLEVGTHRHLGAVHMFTLSGTWGYREHDDLNVAGSYLYEPPGSIHTLYVPVESGDAETLTVIYGRTEYLGPDGDVIAVSDAASNLREYLEACEAAGLPRPTAIIR